MINPYQYKASVTQFIDGDTAHIMIDLGFGASINEVMRFYGIDAPELSAHSSGNTLEGEAGRLVASYVQSTLEGRDFYVESFKAEDASEDMYGRYLLNIYLTEDESVSLNELLVSKGYAHAYDGKGKRPSWRDDELNAIIHDLGGQPNAINNVPRE